MTNLPVTVAVHRQCMDKELLQHKNISDWCGSVWCAGKQSRKKKESAGVQSDHRIYGRTQFHVE